MKWKMVSLIREYIREHPASVCVALVGCLGLAALEAQFLGFALDDTYITFRYSRHLSEGAGLVWNIGEDPVEGFTSFLWVVLNAGAIRLNLDPLAFSKVISFLASVTIVLILSVRCRNMSWLLGLPIVAGVALNPAFAFLSMMGMETTIAAFLMLLGAVLSVRLIDRWSAGTAFALHGTAILSMWCRPDSAPFVVGLFLGIVGVLVATRRYADLRRFLVTLIVPATIGFGYMFWRLRYFGFLFPNTFYRKTTFDGPWLPVYLQQYVSRGPLPGLSYVMSFAADFALPYLIVAALLLTTYKGDAGRVRRLIPPLLGAGAFAASLIFILQPIQGMLWRFVMPVWPVVLCILADSLRDCRLAEGRLRMRKAPCCLLALFFLVWPIRLNREARFLNSHFSLRDRILVGKALAGIQGTMFITDSGALPYYSGWRAVDHLGLNSETIAHEGLSVEFLKRLNPDMIMLSMRNGDDRWNDFPIVKDYLSREGFSTAAVIRKNPARLHFYLVRRGSPLFADISRKIRGLDVTYVAL